MTIPEERRALRAGIDVVLAADPGPFRAAHRAAVMTFAEDHPHMSGLGAMFVIDECVSYEAIRGAMTRPSEKAARRLTSNRELRVYERSRGAT